VVAHSAPPQSTTSSVGSVPPDLHAVASSATCPTSLSYSTPSRHSSKVGAVCVEALVRFCAGGGRSAMIVPAWLHGNNLEKEERKKQRKNERNGVDTNPPSHGRHYFVVDVMAILDMAGILECVPRGLFALSWSKAYLRALTYQMWQNAVRLNGEIIERI
jgi:hypothetical protein